MVEAVPIYHKVIDVNAHQDILAKIVKKKKVAAKLIHAQHVQCAKMKLDMEIIHAYVAVDILVTIVM